MTFERRLSELRGDAARRAIEACCGAMEAGRASSRQVRLALRCEPCPEMGRFDRFLAHRDPILRGNAAKVLAKWSPERVVEAILEERDSSALSMMLQALVDVGYSDVDDLTPILRRGDALAEKAFQAFVKVGRADLLFTLAVGGDDITTERVRRYLDEQGWLDQAPGS